MLASTPIRVRKMTQADLAPLYQLYLAQEKQIPYQPRTRFAQFAADLRVSRAYPDASHYEPKAEIAVVAEVGGAVVAYADGCKVNEAKGLVKGGQAFIRMVIGSRGQAEAVKKVIRRVTQHLLKFNPDVLQAFSSYITPVFRGFAGGKLHAEWAWLGQCLVDEGYAAGGFGLRMYRPLMGRGNAPKPLPVPKGIEIEFHHRFGANGLRHLPQKYVLRHFISDFALCENYYSGAFVKGSGFQYLFTLWVVSMSGHQRKGYARWFIRNALCTAHAAGAKGAMLMTAVDNFRSQSLYSSEGYETAENVCSFTYRGQTT